MSSLDYLDLCRLCLVKDRVSVPIFEGEGDVRQIFLKIAACLPVKVAREDKLPKKICDDCVYKVELFYQFWNTTANAEKQLLQWLGEVGLEDKQGYVTSVLNPSVMKQEQTNENRLDGNVMQQVSGHQNNMGMGMMDNMGLGMPMMMSTANQPQITSVPMDTSGSSVQNVQAVPGPSTQTTHEQIPQNQTSTTQQQQQEDEEESSEEDENSDEECDGDEGLPVKEESEEDPNNSRTIEPTTFVNVSLACDEAGPSGLQQQKIAEMPEMSMPQAPDDDPKSGSDVNRIIETDSQGRLIVGRDAVPMKLWQRVDSGGKLHYSLIPAHADKSVKSEETKNLHRSIKIEVDELTQKSTIDEGNRYCSLVHLCEVAIDNHICEKCGMKFPTESMLTRHKMSHDVRHWLRRRKLKTSDEKYNLKSMSKKNREVKQQQSERLEKRTTSRGKRKKNEECESSSASSNKSFACRLCDHKCSTQASLNKHTWEHKNEESPCFTCDSCGFECKRSSTLASHVARNHSKSEGEIEYPRKKCKLEKCTYSTTEKNDDCLREPEQDNEPLVCTACDFQCEKRSTMTTHVAKKHVKKSLEEHCNLCDFKCSKKSTLYSHKRRHKAENMNEVYACNECGFKTSKKTSLYSHIKRKHKVPKSCTGEEQPELFYCNQCDYKNKNKYELKVHVARKHTDDFKFSCETCGKKFKVKGDLTNHIRFSHREQPVICDVCGKTCLNSNSLYVHQKFAHYKAKYECQVCKRRMVSQENLNEHMLRQHERRENVVCEECGKTFSRNSRLKVHMRIHTGDKPYTCTICNKSFARRTALKQHLLIHTGIRPYVCDICGKAFTQKPGLISHRKSHPGSHPPLPRVLIDHILNDVMNN